MEFRVEWVRTPSDHNPHQVLFIKARDAEDAKNRAIDRIEREHGIARFRIVSVKSAPTFEEIQ